MKNSKTANVERLYRYHAKPIRIQNSAMFTVERGPSHNEIESMKPAQKERFWLQRNCIEDIQKGMYLNKKAVNHYLNPDKMYEDIRKKYGNHSGVYNIITGN